MGSDGDDRLGGADFDSSVAHLLTEQHSLVLENLSSYSNKSNHDDMAEILSSSCDRITDDLPLCSVSSFHTLGEKVKISLSEQQKDGEKGDSIVAQTQCLALPPVHGEANSASLKSMCDSLYVETLEVSLDQYNKVVQPLFDRSVIPATRLIEDLTLQKEEIDEIVMVGGTTKMPQIRELVRNAFPNAQLNTHIDPDITVVRDSIDLILFCSAFWSMTILPDAWLLTRDLKAGVVTRFTSLSLLMLAVIMFSKTTFLSAVLDFRISIIFSSACLLLLLSTFSSSTALLFRFFSRLMERLLSLINEDIWLLNQRCYHQIQIAKYRILLV